jgi:hypothetical protein
VVVLIGGVEVLVLVGDVEAAVPIGNVNVVLIWRCGAKAHT